MNFPLILLAFGAGMLSFLSPCVLPLVPIYLGYLSGAAVTPEGVTVSRGQVMTHALIFVAGFTTIFVAIWSALFALTQVLDGLLLASNSNIGAKQVLSYVAGSILVIFGVIMVLGAILNILNLRLPNILPLQLFYQDTRLQMTMRELGYPRSFLTGMAFAAGWTPCVGPMLGLIITAATQTQTAIEGTALLLMYSAGLGVPFLVTAFALDSMVARLKGFNKYLHIIEIVSGVILIVVGLLLLTNQFQILNAYFYSITPQFIFELENNLAKVLGIDLNQ